MSCDEMMAKIRRFNADRDWDQFHNPKDLAISISLEANELLEIFQWKSAEEASQDREHIAEELADVLIYCFQMADRLGMDVEDIMNQKIAKNAKKYPVEKAKGRKDKYTEL